MLLSIDGGISVVAAFVNLITISSLLDLDISTTKLYAKLPFVKLIFLFTFAYSVIPKKAPCLLAVALFFVLEIKNFVEDVLEDDSVKVLDADVDDEIDS